MIDTCGHCGGPIRGYATIGDTKLCHPDDGMDCYTLVTLYGHGAPCGMLETDRLYFDAVDEFVAEWDGN